MTECVPTLAEQQRQFVAKHAAGEETSCPSNSTGALPSILSRIYVTPEGNLVVTDLWEGLETALVQNKGFTLS